MWTSLMVWAETVDFFFLRFGILYFQPEKLFHFLSPFKKVQFGHGTTYW